MSPSKQQPTGNRSGRAKSSNRPNGKEKAQGKADKASSGKGSVKGVKGAAGEEKLDNVQLLHSTEIREEIESLMQRAAELDASADAVGARDSFEHRLGSALLAQTKPLPELVREWDKNGDGDINTIEVRALLWVSIVATSVEVSVAGPRVANQPTSASQSPIPACWSSSHCPTLVPLALPSHSHLTRNPTLLFTKAYRPYTALRLSLPLLALSSAPANRARAYIAHPI